MAASTLKALIRIDNKIPIHPPNEDRTPSSLCTKTNSCSKIEPNIRMFEDTKKNNSKKPITIVEI